jgi:hypothetical protein
VMSMATHGPSLAAARYSLNPGHHFLKVASRLRISKTNTNFHTPFHYIAESSTTRITLHYGEFVPGRLPQLLEAVGGQDRSRLLSEACDEDLRERSITNSTTTMAILLRVVLELLRSTLSYRAAL